MQTKPMTLCDKARILESHGMNEAEIAAALGRRPCFVRAALLRDSPQTARIERYNGRNERGRFAEQRAL